MFLSLAMKLLQLTAATTVLATSHLPLAKPSTRDTLTLMNSYHPANIPAILVKARWNQEEMNVYAK